MKRNFLLLSIILVLFGNQIAAQTKQNAIKEFTNHTKLNNASIGICVKDMSGKEIAASNANISYTPASILKIVTTATAMETLGADFRYKTTLASDKYDKNKLYIHGYGDPTLGTEHLDNSPTFFLTEWADKIKASFANEKNINITVIDNYFGYEGVSQRWIREDIGNYFAAAAYGISIFDNSYKLYFNTMRRDTCPIIERTDPEMRNMTFRNTMKINTTGGDNGYIIGDLFSNQRLLIGDIPGGKNAFSIKGDIPNPGLYLGEKLSEQLATNGLSVNNVATTYNLYFDEMYNKRKTSFNENVFYTHQSLPLRDIVRDVNVRSNNHYAEHLIRTIGRAANNDIYSSSLDEGIKKANELWKSRGLNTNALFMYDGCGLAPSNAVSSTFLCDLLVYMQTKSENSEAFLESFAKAGKDGTVRNFLKGTRLAGKVYVKSGSIANVQCYSGYYIDGDKKYAFTVMVNKFNGPRNQVRRAIENLLLGIL